MDNNNFELQFKSSSKKISPFKKIAKRQKTKRKIVKAFIPPTNTKNNKPSTRKKISSLDFLEQEMCAVSSISKHHSKVKINPQTNDYVMTGTRTVQYHYQNGVNSPRNATQKPRTPRTQSDSSTTSHSSPRKTPTRRLSL